MHNFIFVSIDGAVNKFNLSTKELEFKFQASCYRTMILFDNDERLLTADSKQAKLWQLDDDQNPQLITSYSIEGKLDTIFCNQNAVDDGTLFYFVILRQDQKGFILCKNKLEEIWTYEGEDTLTTCADFTHSSSGKCGGGETFAIGTTEGEI